MVKLKIINPVQEEKDEKDEQEEQEEQEEEDEQEEKEQEEKEEQERKKQLHDERIRRYLEKNARQAKLRIIQKTPDRFYIVTTRFNQKTWSENKAFREKHKGRYACIYSSEAIISPYIPQDAYLFVLEMNNDTNQIEGIGLILNRPLLKRFPIYEDNKYNRFHYGSKHWIGRDEIINEENQIKYAVYINCWKLLEQRCFKGSTHLKRGRNITAFPLDMTHIMEGDESISIIDVLRLLHRELRSL